MMKVRDMPPRQFIRNYAERINDLDTLKLGLFLSCGDSPDQAARLAVNGDYQRVGRAVHNLATVGYIKIQDV